MQGFDERALPKFQSAYRIARTPRTAAQLGLAEMGLGYWLDAERHVAEGLASVDHPWIRKQHELLERALTTIRTNISTVIIMGTPPGASILINGKSVGVLPLTEPVRLPKGPIDLELRAPGYLASRQSLTLQGGPPVRIGVDLKRAVAEIAAPPAGASQPSASTRTVEAPSITAPAKDSGSGFFRKVAWATMIGAGASFVFAAFETSRWLAKTSEFENHRVPPPDLALTDMSRWRRDCGADDPMHGGAACDEIYHSLSWARASAIVGYAVGGELAAGAVSAFVRSGDRPSERRMACAPSAQGIGVGCQLLF